MYRSKVQTRVEGPRGPLLLPPVWTPETWVALSPRQKQFVYEACTSFKFFMHHVFMPYHSEVEGEKWPKELPWHIAQLCDDLEAAVPNDLVPFHKDDPTRPIMVWILPTGHFKSSTAHALCVWLIGINRGVSILAVSGSAETAERAVSTVKLHLTQNERFIDVFGPARFDDTEGPWQSRKFTVERPVKRGAPTMFAAGVETNIEGHRYDIAVADDVTTAHNSSTPGSRAAVKEVMTKVVWQRLHPSRRILLVLGTMHHNDDYLAELKRRAEAGDSMVSLRQFPAILRGKWPPDKAVPQKPYRLPDGTWNVVWDDELEVLWPEFWGRERLLEDWLQDPAAFALTRMHIVHAPEGQLFPQEILEHNCRADGRVNNFGIEKPNVTAWVPEFGRERNEITLVQQGITLKRLVLAIDPAATGPRPGTDPDYTAIELWGLSEDGLRILLWLDRFRTGDPQVARQRIGAAVRSFEADDVVYEGNAMARYFAVDMSRELGVPVRSRELKKGKTEELNALAGFAAAGMMLYAWGDERSRTMMAPFEQELAAYPSKHDDTIMAALHAFHIMQQRRGPEGGIAKILRPGDHLERFEENEEQDKDTKQQAASNSGDEARKPYATQRPVRVAGPTRPFRHPPRLILTPRRML